MNTLKKLCKSHGDTFIEFERDGLSFVVRTRVGRSHSCIIEYEVEEKDPCPSVQRGYYLMPEETADSTTAQFALMRNLENKDPATLDLIADSWNEKILTPQATVPTPGGEG